jgi:phosphomevalonate kinase
MTTAASLATSGEVKEYEKIMGKSNTAAELSLKRPVATQLERIEQGLDKLMQSHAALDKLIQERRHFGRQGFREVMEHIKAIERKLDKAETLAKSQALLNDLILGLLQPTSEPIMKTVEWKGGALVFTPSHTLRLGSKAKQQPKGRKHAKAKKD